MKNDDFNQENEKKLFEEESQADEQQEEIVEDPVEHETGEEQTENPEDFAMADEHEEEVQETAIEPVIVETPEPEPKREPAFRRFLNFLFGRESPVGKVMRPVLRVIALGVGMLAIGLLIAYFTLYLPLTEQRDQAVLEIQRLNMELEDSRAALADSEEELQVIESETQSTIEGFEAENELLNFRVRFLIVKNDVLRARMALLDQENGPGGPTAMAALNDLEDHLDDLTPYVEEDDPVLADLLQNRLQVVRGEFARDAQQARMELESFYSNLLELEDTLF